MLQFKPEVRVRVFSDRLGAVLAAATQWSLVNRTDVRVNSINDGPGVHMATSLHYFDLAVDLGVNGDKPADRQALAEYLRRWLDPQYDVVFEGDHVHVEWDARRPALRALASAPATPAPPAVSATSQVQGLEHAKE